jgi:transmembrane sensor
MHNMEKEALQKLFKKYHEGKCTEDEKALLEAWYLDFNEHELDISSKKIRVIGKRIFRELPGNHIAFFKIGVKLALAAGVIGMMIAIGFKYMRPNQNPNNTAVIQEIKPGGNNAILTLASGQKINLSTATNGQIAKQGGTHIYKIANGQISYKPIALSAAGNVMLTNTISTPKGGQWKVTLPDGTKVWLNSLTSFSYPESFAQQKKRVVSLQGEAYFEVARDKTHPFIVRTNNQTVEVLGTHFNINSYTDEQSIKTTLSEGRVKVSTLSGKMKMLKPGHQSIVTDQEIEVKEVDVNEMLAWKNGYFQFNDEPINSVMKKLGRWYNFEILYKGAVPSDNINGKISRNKDLSQVLKALEATKTVHFIVEGRRVIVMK